MSLDPHGGNIYAYDGVKLDFSVNLNPLGMPEEILQAVRDHGLEYDRYPDPNCRALRRALAAREGVPEEWLVFGNGAADLIVRLAMAVKPRQALVPAPTFSEYEAAVKLAGGETRRFFLDGSRGYRVTADYAGAVRPGDEMVFLCNPNNPTGSLAEPGTVAATLEACSRVGAVLVVDECFLPFTDGPSCKGLLQEYPNLIVLRAFTKLYAMAGLRLGYLLCSGGDLAGRIAAWGQCWSVSTPAQVAGLAALSLPDWEERTRRYLLYRASQGGRQAPGDGLSGVPFRQQLPAVLGGGDPLGPGHGAGRDAPGLWQLSRLGYRLLPHRPQGAASKRGSAGGPGGDRRKRMAKAIMIQGTTSNAGKSFLAAALCRIFAQDGYRVAPFKSQNMALNSYITDEGLEMGRAQVMQAEAAGVKPSVRMNPILLKPTGDTGSQVIVNGEVRGNMTARDYFAMKRSLIPDILAAYRSLAAEYDILVIEGAGSPAEINLKKDDIVNMGMAALADCPVLLCGDIDRGGVFASLYGTVALLEPEEQARIQGLVINKFRGDKAILDPGLTHAGGAHREEGGGGGTLSAPGFGR